MKTKTLLQCTVLLLFTLPSVYYLITGQNGIQKYYHLHKELIDEQKKIATLEEKINTLKAHITLWNSSTFEHEKIARQDLSMSYTNELIFLTPHTTTSSTKKIT